MTSKQWLLISVVLAFNIVIFGALLGDPPANPRATPTPTWTPHPTFTPTPFPTQTAIVMPTVDAPPPSTAVPTTDLAVHIVREGETLEEIAEQYDVSTFILRMINRIPEQAPIYTGQELVIPIPAE